MAGIEERRQTLLDDSDISIVEAHRVFCNRCDKWLKLDEAKLYAASVWRCHKNTKSHIARAPSSSVSAPPPPKIEGTNGTSGHQTASVSGSQKGQGNACEPPHSPPSDQDLQSANSTQLSATTPVPRSLPRLRLKVPASVTGSLTPGSASALNIATLVSTTPPMSSSKHSPWRAILETAMPTQPISSKSDSSQRSMPPPTPSIHKGVGHLPSQSIQPETFSTGANLLHQRSSGSSKPFTEVRSASDFGKDREPSSSSTSASRALPPPERLSPHRKASYKALVAEPYIDNLEPYRVFCTLCKRWINLSSRTPYSYGIWKGHVRKNHKLNGLPSTNADEQYDTASEHSQDESGLHPTSECVEDVQRTAGTNNHEGVHGTLTLVSLLESDAIPADTNSKNAKHKLLDSPDSTPVESNRLQHTVITSSFDLHHASVSRVQDGVFPRRNPYTLKATNEDSFGPRRHLKARDEPPESKGSQLSILESDDMLVLTETSEEEPSSSQLSTKMAPITALEKRRAAMLADPDAAIVESRRIQCRLCERWIKGSNTQEYSSHHWLKHKKKCSRTPNEGDRWPEPAEARKARLEADPDLETLEPHRALCRPCNKWVKLCSRSRYSASHWTQHKRKCPSLQSKPDAAAQAEGSAPAPSTQSVDNMRSLSSKQSQPLSTSESRHATLFADPDILQLLPDRVQCRSCNRWIKLSMPVEHSPGQWLDHKETCLGQASDSATKLQAALETRKKSLEDDPDVAELEPHRVHCVLCGSWVKLRPDCSYSLGKWHAHKQRCGQRSRRTQGGSSADAATTVNEIEMEQTEIDVDDLGDDYREAMDVEDALKHEHEPEDEEIRHRGLHRSADDTGPLLTDSNEICNEHVAIKVQKQDEAYDRNLLPTHVGDSDGDVEMVGFQPDSSRTDDVARDELGEEDGDKRKDRNDGQKVVTTQKAAEGVILELLGDPDVVYAQVHRVWCSRCQSCVELKLTHKAQCLGENEDSNRNIKAVVLNGVSHGHLSSRQSDDLDIAQSRPDIDYRSSQHVQSLFKEKYRTTTAKRVRSRLAQPPVQLPPRWPDEDERKQQFIDDPDVVRVEPHRILCKHCNCWLRLHPIIRYSQSIWPLHKASCKDRLLFVPGDAKSRAKSEKEEIRKQLLEEDPYAIDVEPHRVTCKACGTNIRLDTIYKFEGSHWRAHRSRCVRIPFHERLVKKRKAPEQAQDRMVTDSSDSDDSDASSAPRPRPTSFFTAPLVIRPTEMFKSHSRLPSTSEAASEATSEATPKVQAKANLAACLNELAVELNASGRLISIVQSAGDGVTSEEQQQQHQAIAQLDVTDVGSLWDVGRPLTPSMSPSPDPETWIPRKRTREEDAAFDTFFTERRLPSTPPRPKGKVRICKLGKEAMQAVD